MKRFRDVCVDFVSRHLLLLYRVIYRLIGPIARENSVEVMTLEDISGHMCRLRISALATPLESDL